MSLHRGPWAARASGDWQCQRCGAWNTCEDFNCGECLEKQCDCCGRMSRDTSTFFAFGIETTACEECRDAES